MFAGCASMYVVCCKIGGDKSGDVPSRKHRMGDRPRDLRLQVQEEEGRLRVEHRQDDVNSLLVYLASGMPVNMILQPVGCQAPLQNCRPSPD